MRLTIRTIFAASIFVAAGLAAGCASDGGPTSPGGGSGDAADSAPTGGTWEDGEAVRGNVSVTWKNLNPANPPASASLVNESSEIGQKLKSGRASSSEIRVVSDAQMGGLLAQLKKLGFFQYATDGLGLDNLPSVAGPRGIVVVSQDGHSKGLMLTTNLGPGPVPEAYRDSKSVVIIAHSQVQGFDVKANVGAPDERVFTAPRPTLRRP
jgi:hypothetical protein